MNDWNTDFSPEKERHIPLAGATNFRDFGGYASRAGGVVRWRKLYRSDRLSRLSAEDFNALAPLGIRYVCDLRRPLESQRAPTQWAGDSIPELLPMPLIGDRGVKTISRIVEEMKTSDDKDIARRAMIGLYRHLVTDPQVLSYYREIFTLLAKEEGTPILVHCSGGKDRTGVCCALILWSLGVSDKDIFEDYMLSQSLYCERIDFSKMIPQVLDLGSLGGLDIEGLRPVYSVEPAYLEAAMELIEQNYRHGDAFLAEGLGLDTATIDALKIRLLQ